MTATIGLAQQAYDVLRDRLVTLDIAPGTAIHDEAVAAELGVGRTPVREALKRLESQRLVVAHPRRGTFATEVNITDLGHICEVRAQLEPLAATLAAARATESDRAALRTLAARLSTVRRGSTSSTLMRLDMQVHRGVYAATHNPFLEDTLAHYDDLATRIWWLFLARLPGLAGHVGEHLPLLDAIVHGDEGRAAELAAQHVAHFDRAVRSAL